MRSKGEIATVTEKSWRGSAPTLRFIGFDGEWKSQIVGDLCLVLNNRRKPVTSTNRVAGPYPYYGASGIVDHINDFLFDEPLVLVGEDGAKWAAYENTAFIANGKYWVNNHAHVLRPLRIVNSMLVSYLTMADLSQFVTGAAPPKLTLEKLKKIPIPLPSSREEQQKIADCLSSTDACIDAEVRKLDTLKAHKQGLMQQLFPAEGQRLPNLRFPQFRTKSEWDTRMLNQISPCIFDGTHQTPSYTSEGIPFFSVENIVSGSKNKFISLADHVAATRKNKPEEGDVIITRIGRIGYSVVINWSYEFSIYVTLAVIKKSLEVDSYFLHGYFQSGRYQKEVLSKSLLSAVPCKINMDELRKTEVLLPKIDEQRKIAGCLSSLDDLVTAQSRKIAALRQHKQGLMQGLFPAMETPAP